MSRRRGEFEHRTSIFEGAFRAWSHLGGLDPELLETRPAADLDPLSHPIQNDPRDANETKESKNASETMNADGTRRRIFPYEPLPRSGLAHPYVQAVLSPWLGPDADNDAIQLGLTTLRTWWQHRRKGESGSAIAALGTEKMRGVVEGYTRHFFNLAHCLVVSDKEQPPRSLFVKMKELEKLRSKLNKKRAREEQAGKLATLAMNAGIAHGFNPMNPASIAAASINADLSHDSDMTPLERLHAAQRRQLLETGGIHSAFFSGMGLNMNNQMIPLRGKCIPGKIDLPAVVNAVNHNASQLAHRGINGGYNTPSIVPSSREYGDPNLTPVVFVSNNGDIQIAMSVEGITCAHCVKIVETVLKGCNGNKSPIDGLLDAAADQVLCKVLIRIDLSSNAKRVAFEAARNLAMVGYTAKAHEMSIVNEGGDRKATVDLGALSTAFEVVASTDPLDMFDWSIPCTCPDSGIMRHDCSRHSQMNTRIFDAFITREKQVSEYMAGCGQQYGMPCTCGPNCRCANCSEHCRSSKADALDNCCNSSTIFPTDASTMSDFGAYIQPAQDNPKENVTRNLSIISFGGNMRHMSMTSEATYGRAMSGLSALSIDWENMEDFDVNVDHSAHINNGSDIPPGINIGGRGRLSMRRSINGMNASAAAAAAAAAASLQDAPESPHHVSFKV